MKIPNLQFIIIMIIIKPVHSMAFLSYNCRHGVFRDETLGHQNLFVKVLDFLTNVWTFGKYK